MNFKRHYLIIVVTLLTFILLGICINIAQNYYKEFSINESKKRISDTEKYYDFIKTLNEINVEGLNVKIDNGDTFYVFTGRSTCEYCVKIVRELEIILFDVEIIDYNKKNNIQIHYLNSENTHNDVKIQQFREKYDIKYVPSVIYFKDGSSYTLELKLNEDKYDLNAVKNEFYRIIEMDKNSIKNI